MENSEPKEFACASRSRGYVRTSDASIGYLVSDAPVVITILASTYTLSSTYKGFGVRVVPRNEVHFGYEIRSRGSSTSIQSPDAFVTQRAALTAARRFIDDVDRRLGLGTRVRDEDE